MLNLYTKILLLIVGIFPINLLAGENPNLNQAMINGLLGTFQAFLPIFFVIIIINILVLIFKCKPEILAYGCGVVFLVVFAISLIGLLIAFVDAHRNFFICLGAVLLSLLAAFVIYACYGKDAEDGNEKIQNDVKTSKKRDLKENVSSPQKDVSTKRKYQDQFEIEYVGKKGEKDMCSAILNACRADKRYYKLLCDLYIPKDGGRRTTQIDALLLHESGIYCFECKNLSGEITGTLEMEQWEQVKYSGEKKFFFNPIIQNDGHLEELRRFMKLSKDNFRSYSCIVFGVRSYMVLTPNDFANISFHYVNTLEKELSADLRTRKTVYNKPEIDRWMNKLCLCVDVSERVKLSHKRDVQRRFS